MAKEKICDKDLTGMKVGVFTILRRNPDKKFYWICQCKCGEEKSLQTYHILKGNVPEHCGKCVRKKVSQEWIGKKVGRLTIISIFRKYNEDGSRGHLYCECKCDCGGTKTTRKNLLACSKGYTQSCGCLQRENMAKIRPETLDLVGEKYGKLLVKSKAKTTITQGKHRELYKSYWNCVCECGNKCVVSTNNLRMGKTQSCGCIKSELKEDLSGKRFGKWIVLKEYRPFSSGRKHQKGFEWLCKCDCGEERFVKQFSLLSGGSKSCGCLQRETAKLPEGEAAFNGLFGIYARGAKDRGYDFVLTKEEFKKLTKGKCFYCGSEPDYHMKRDCSSYSSDYVYNGIDRIDNTKGYFPQNCVSCCRVCNFMKSKIPFDAFVEHIKKMAKNIGENGDVQKIL